MSFSEILNQYKSDLNLTQSALAGLCGTSPAVISRYLSGKRLPDTDSDILDKIAEGIEKASAEKGILGNDKTTVKNKLLNCIEKPAVTDDFYDKMDSILEGFDISNTELSKALPFDASYISRVRNRKRKPKDPEEFLKMLEEYIKNISDSNKKSNPVSKPETEINPEHKGQTKEEPKICDTPDISDSDTENPQNPRKLKKRMSRFEYFLYKVSGYLRLK